MPRIIAIASQKGGVGKTTTSVNLAYFLQLAGRRTLLVDLDPQANATSGLGCEPATTSAFQILSESPGAWNRCIQATSYRDLYVAPAVINFDYAPIISRIDPVQIAAIRDGLLDLDPGYEFVLFDCPPATGPIPMLALQLADSILIPVQCEYYAMEGLSQMLPTIEKIRMARTRALDIEGILLTMFDDHLQLSHEVRAEVERYFTDATLSTVIPRDVALAEATSFGQPVYEYDPRANSAWSYLKLAKEVLNGR